MGVELAVVIVEYTMGYIEMRADLRGGGIPGSDCSGRSKEESS